MVWVACAGVEKAFVFSPQKPGHLNRTQSRQEEALLKDLDDFFILVGLVCVAKQGHVLNDKSWYRIAISNKQLTRALMVYIYIYIYMCVYVYMRMYTYIYI